MCGDGKTESEVRRRAQSGGNTWRAVKGVVADRRISKRLEGKVMSTCVKLACVYGTETLALTKRNTTAKAARVQQNNWVRDESADEVDTYTGDEQTTMGRAHRKDGR